MTNATEPKPCGKIHLLPCGLEIDCEVPIGFFEPDKNSEEIWEEYQEAID